MNSGDKGKALTTTDASWAEFNEIVYDIIHDPNVEALKEHMQHIYTTRFEHCQMVAFHTYSICKKIGLDYVSAARGAMLHDFYFYDWRNKHVEGQKKFHLMRHPNIALTNALDIFELNDLEKDIIKKHMWPVTAAFPSYKETFIVTCVDKYCATSEFFRSMKKKFE